MSDEENELNEKNLEEGMMLLASFTGEQRRALYAYHRSKTHKPRIVVYPSLISMFMVPGNDKEE